MRWTAGPENTACVAHAETLTRAGVHDRLGRVRERAGGVDHVVDDDGVLALHVADDVHDLGDVRRARRLSMIARRRVEALRVRARALDAAGVGRDDDGVVAAEPERAQLLDDDRHREQVVERDVEEALDLPGVEVDRERAIGARGGDEVRDELAR